MKIFLVIPWASAILSSTKTDFSSPLDIRDSWVKVIVNGVEALTNKFGHLTPLFIRKQPNMHDFQLSHGGTWSPWGNEAFKNDTITYRPVPVEDTLVNENLPFNIMKVFKSASGDGDAIILRLSSGFIFKEKAIKDVRTGKVFFNIPFVCKSSDPRVGSFYSSWKHYSSFPVLNHLEKYACHPMAFCRMEHKGSGGPELVISGGYLSAENRIPCRS